MLNPMVMLNFLVVLKKRGGGERKKKLSGCSCTVFCVLCVVLYCTKVQHGHQKYFAKTKFNMAGKVELKWSCWITLK